MTQIAGQKGTPHRAHGDSQAGAHLADALRTGEIHEVEFGATDQVGPMLPGLDVYREQAVGPRGCLIHRRAASRWRHG